MSRIYEIHVSGDNDQIHRQALTAGRARDAHKRLTIALGRN